jgi:hypothetical protein
LPTRGHRHEQSQICDSDRSCESVLAALFDKSRTLILVAIDEVLAALAERDFGTVDRKTILRAVAAAAGHGFAVDDMDRLRGSSVDELRSVVAATAASSKRGRRFPDEPY